MFEFVTYYYDKLKDNIIWMSSKFWELWLDDGQLDVSLANKYSDL